MYFHFSMLSTDSPRKPCLCEPKGRLKRSKYVLMTLSPFGRSVSAAFVLTPSQTQDMFLRQWDEVLAKFLQYRNAGFEPARIFYQRMADSQSA